MIPHVDLTRQHAALRPALLAAMARVLDSSRFILGPEGTALEGALAARCGVRHGIGVGSGTDALRLALEALDVGPGDEVITPAFSFVASSSTIAWAGATPVFVDIDPETYALDDKAIERAITPRTRGIVAVHLYGHAAAMGRITALARDHGLFVIEDAPVRRGEVAGVPGRRGRRDGLSFTRQKSRSGGTAALSDRPRRPSRASGRLPPSRRPRRYNRALARAAGSTSSRPPAARQADGSTSGRRPAPHRRALR